MKKKFILKQYYNFQSFGKTHEKNKELQAITQKIEGLCSIVDTLANSNVLIGKVECRVMGVVMEYIKGDNLENFIVADQTLDTIVKIIQQILSIMSQFHEQGYIHRDLKPENIMVSPDHQVTIIDFEYALKSDICHRGLGTPLYMAPEIASHIRYNNKCDVYSFGVILYRLIEKRDLYHAVYDGRNDKCPYDNISEGYIRYLSDVCQHKMWKEYPKLYDLLRGCLDMDMTTRFSMLEAYTLSKNLGTHKS